MIYLSRLETAEVNLAEFEQYCAIKCPIKGRVEKDEAEDSLWL